MLHGELMIANAETAQRPDNDPQRREYVVAECYMIFRALIKDAVQQSLDDPDQFHIADLLTTAPEPLRDPDLALKLARRAVELKPEDGHCMRSLGWALYRSGDYRGSYRGQWAWARRWPEGLRSRDGPLATGREGGGPSPLPQR